MAALVAVELCSAAPLGGRFPRVPISAASHLFKTPPPPPCLLSTIPLKPFRSSTLNLHSNRFGNPLKCNPFWVSSDDGSKSSSPDASMADIMPMLDELHPLLDSEAPQPAHIPIDDSDVSSQGYSHESDEGSAESGEEAHEDQEDKTEAVVKWTEDDQKNLMDLGTSELERNRRLENLIAKRMAWKHQRIAIEKNLIDLENNDVQTTLPMSGGPDHIQFQVPPISTARRNPSDFPYDSNEIGGLPPIPGSAPSVLLPRWNPFDLPYERLDD